MAVIINATTTTGLTTSADNSGVIQFQSNGANTVGISSTGYLTIGGNQQIYGPAFLASADGTQSVSNNTFTKLLIPTKTFDTANAVSSSTFTPLVAGYYVFSFVANFSATSGQMFCELRKNGSRFALGSIVPGTAIEGVSAGSAIAYMNGSTDYVEIYGYQNSGGSVTSRGSTYLSGSMVRGA